MTQLAIAFDAQHAARRNDPETSHAAARKAETFATSHAGRILAALKTHGPRTAHGLELLIGLTVVQIDRRTVELERAGHIRVVKLNDGADKTEGGFRVWEAVQ